MVGTKPLGTQQLRALIRKHKRLDALFGVLGLLALMVGVLTLAALFAGMAIDGIPRLTGDFFTSFPSRRAGQAGILSAWVGSILVMLVTAVFAVPVGIYGAIYLEEYAKKSWFTDVIEINITNLAGVPSIVYGLLALGLFVYTFGFGQSILSAGLTLALLILPIVIVTTREALRAIPQHIREGAYACGASQWQVVHDHLLPYGMPGILTGVIIGMARAIGETAPIITIGALTFIAFLPPLPFGGCARLAVLAVHGDADPDLQLDVSPGSGLPSERSGGELRARVHDAGHERPGHLAALPPAQEHQVVIEPGSR
jgi:phosphate transport system permease protein